MKKLSTLFAAAAMALAANATVVWEGSVEMGNWKGELGLDCESKNWTSTCADAFADLQEGSQIVFHYTDVSTDTEAPGQIQIDAKVGPSWTWTAIVEYDVIEGDSYTYTLTGAPIGDTDYTDVETFAERGIFVKGQNATLVKIEILPPAGTVETETKTINLWTGSYKMGSWTGMFEFQPDNAAAWTTETTALMKGLKAGDKLVFGYADCGSNPQISINVKTGAAWTWTEVIPYADIKNDKYTYKVTADAMAGDTDYTVLEVMQERGFIIKGQNATLVSIDLVTTGEGGDDPTPPTPPTPSQDGIVLWTGEVVMGAWKGMFEYKNVPENTQWKADAMSSLEEGDKLVFHYTDVSSDSEAPGQIQFVTFAGADWTWTELVKYDNIVGTSWTYTIADDIPDGCDYTDIEMISEHGVAAKGQNATLVKLELVKKNGAGLEKVAADTIDFNAPVEIYTIDGRRVAEMTAGRIYIVRQGDKVMKLAK